MGRVCDLTLEEIEPRRVRLLSTGAECLQTGWWRDAFGRPLYATVVLHTSFARVDDIAPLTADEAAP